MGLEKDLTINKNQYKQLKTLWSILQFSIRLCSSSTCLCSSTCMEKISFSNSQNYIVHCQTKLKKIERCLQLEQKKENKNPQPPNPNRQWYKGDRLHPTRKTRISFQNINKSHLSGSVFNINSHRMMHAAATQAQNISKPVQYKTQRLRHT